MTPLAVSAPVKALAFLVFIAAVAGATWGVQSVIGDDVKLTSVSAKTGHAVLNGTAGHTVGYAVTVENRDSTPASLSVELEGPGASGAAPARLVTADGRATFFVPVEIDENVAPGTIELKMTIRDATGAALRSRDAFARLVILPPTSVGFAQGDTAQVVYAGRIATTGEMFNTNDESLVGLPFLATDFYRASPGLLPVSTVPRPSVVEGFYEGMLGMQAGETRTITFPAEKGYGPSTVESVEERDEKLEREFKLELRTEQVQRRTFDDYVSNSGQGAGSSFGPGDIFIFTQGPNRWPYAIENISAESVDYRLRVNVDENFTLFPFWENASTVTSVNETHAVFFTTPTTATDAKFTMRAYWPEMSSVSSVTDTEIIVRHDPPAGLKFLVPQAQSQTPVEKTVLSVEGNEIRISEPATSPLAGKALTFDVRLVELRKGA